MVDGLHGLRHDTVVGRDDDDRHVGDLGSAGSHGGERLVARGIEEGDLLSVEIHRVGADVLGDTSRLAFDYVGLADVVQQRCLTVVDVTHHRHDGRTRQQILLAVGLGLDSLLNIHRHELGLEAELLGHDHQSLGVESLVDRHHESQVHAGRYDLHRRHVHHGSQLAHGDELGDLQHRTLLLLALQLLAHLLAYLLALLLAVFRALVLGALRGEAGQRILYLLCYLLVAHFGTNHGLGLMFLLVLAATSLARLGLVRGVGRVLRAALTRTVRLSVAALVGLVDIHFLLVETLALVLAARDHARHVHRAEDLRTGQLHVVGTEYVVLLLGLLRLRGSRGRLFLGGSCGRGGRFRSLGRGLLGRRRGLSFHLGRGSGRLGLRLCGGSLRRFRLLGLGTLRGLLLFGLLFFLGVQVDLAKEFGTRNLVLHVYDVALDYHLLFVAALFGLLGLVERYGRLLERYAFAYVVALVSGDGAVRAELLLKDVVHLGTYRRIGRSVDVHALLEQVVHDGVKSHLELLCHLNEPYFSVIGHILSSVS